MKYEEIKDYLRNSYNENKEENENKKKQIKKTIVDNYILSDYVIKNEQGRRVFKDVVDNVKVKQFDECQTIVEKALNLNNIVNEFLAKKNMTNSAILLKSKAHFELVNEWISLEILYGMELAKRNNQNLTKFDESIYIYSIKILLDYLKETKNCINNINKVFSDKENIKTLK